MNLFIDTISTPAYICLFDENRSIINHISWDIKWNESSTLIPKIDDLIKKNKLKYQDIENIVLINGPGSFTWVRTTVLAANSINYIININMTTISYFDMFSNYPIIKSSSKRDSFFKKNKNSEIEIIENTKLLDLLKSKWFSKIYWETNSTIFGEIEIFDKIDYDNIIKNISFDKLNKVEALYIKKPNIS